jgi:hypothetical protein
MANVPDACGRGEKEKKGEGRAREDEEAANGPTRCFAAQKCGAQNKILLPHFF